MPSVPTPGSSTSSSANGDAGRRSFVIVTSYYPPHLGGVEMYTQELARSLTASGAQVIVLTAELSDRTPNDTSIQKAGSDAVVEHIAAWQLFDQRLPLPNPIAAFRLLGKYLTPEVDLLVQCRFYPLSLLAVIAGRWRGCRVFLFEHGSAFISFHNRFIHSCWRIWEWCCASFLKCFNIHWIAVSHGAGQWLKHFGINTETVLPNGVNLEILPIETSSQALSDALLSKQIIFYAGRLIPEKGLRQLLAAAQSFHEQVPNSILVIAGGGSMSEEIKLAASNASWLVFLGTLASPDIYALMQSSWAFAYPSDYPEGLPTAILEAMAMRLAVMATPRGGIPEVIEHLRTGYLLKSSTSAEILQGLLWMHEHQSEVSSMRDHARRLIEDRFNWPRLCDNFLKTYPKRQI